MIRFPRRAGKSSLTAGLRLFVALSLVLQTVLVVHPGRAVAAPPARPVAVPSAAPLAQPPDDPGFPDPGTVPIMPPPTTEPPVITEQVPVILDLWLDREVLQPAATATLTVTVYNQGYEQAPDLTLILDLPSGLVTTEGQTGAFPL